MVGWGQSTGCFHSPAFVDPESGTTFARPKEKRDLLIRTLLQKAACEEDIPIHIGAQRQPHLPFPPATPHEIQDSLLRTKNSAPGADGIPVVALKRAWPFIQNAVCTLYSWCLEIGWHPLPFRTATLIAIPKPGKHDKSSPPSNRLIALLSVLGKGLERLIAW